MAMSSRCASLLACLGVAGAISTAMQTVLDQHNVYRCMHKVPLLTWDNDIAADAQAWADNGQYKHSPKSQRKVDGAQSGENLAWGTSLSGHAAVKLWYAEVQYTDPYGTADSMEDSTDSSQEIGHYTAMIWSSTTKIGCGNGKATVDGHEGKFWVCQYGPAGNVVGQFSQKVLAPTKTVASCGGSSSDIPGGGNGLTNAAVSASGGGAALPSSCTPSSLLPQGGLCVYGYQCESNFCCPRMKVCLKNSAATVLSSELQVPEDIKPDLVQIIFKSGGTCKDPWTNSQQCLQSSGGQPLSTWNQAMCDCKSNYMTRYEEGTWVTLNTHAGFTCASGGQPVAGASLAATASGALGAGLAIAASALALG